jgi:hypothetical protein
MAVSTADRLSELRLLVPGARSALGGITLERRTATGKPIRPDRSSVRRRLDEPEHRLRL